jgi:thioredoxin:protein disulfide reductase
MNKIRKIPKLALAILFGGLIPVTQVSVAADSAKSATSAKPAPVAKLEDLLEPKDAFKPELRQRDPFTAELKFEIAPGYYLYRDRIRVEHVQVPSSATNAEKAKATKDKSAKPAKPVVAPASILALSTPQGKPIDDPTFGKVEVYEKAATILIDLTKLKSQKEEDVQIALISQGCAAVGVCFPPQMQQFTFKYKPALASPGNWIRAQSDSAISFGKSGLSSLPPPSTPANLVRPQKSPL